MTFHAHSKEIDGAGMRRYLHVQFLLQWFWIIPALLILMFIIRYGAAVPFMDHFPIAESMIKWHDRGYPLWSELIEKQMDSRMLFPRILYWISAVTTGWDQRLELYCGWVVIVLTVIFVGKIGRKTMPPMMAAAFLAFASLLYFSISQYALLLFGVSWSVFVPNCGLVLGLWILGTQSRITVKVLIAAIAAFVASFTFVNGLVLWPLLTLALFATPVKSGKERVWLTGAWLLLMTLGIGYFFHDYQFDGRTRTVDNSDPFRVIGNVAAFVGNGIRLFAELPRQSLDGTRAIGIGGMVLVGLCTLAIALGAFRSRDASCLRPAIAWLTLPLYSLLSGIAVALGRAQLDSMEAISERYPVHAIPLFVSIFPLIYLSFKSFKLEGHEVQRRALWAYSSGILVLLAVATAVNLPLAIRHGEWRQQLRAVAMLIKVAPNPLLVRFALIGDFNTAHRVLLELESRNLLRFDILDDPYLPPVSSQEVERAKRYGAVESIWRNGEMVNVVGWAVRPKKHSKNVDAVVVAVLEADGRSRIFTSSHDTLKLREDVRSKRGRHYAVSCGFHVPFIEPKLKPGTPLTFWAFDADTQKFQFIAGPIPAP